MNESQGAWQKLRAATAAEKASVAKRAVRYKQLTCKFGAYQGGTGPAPTTAEFEEWKEDVQADVALRKLLSGLFDD